MIKLTNILREEKEQYVPYMYSKDGFGCHVCKFYYKVKDKHKCDNEDYQKYMGTSDLLDGKGGQPIKDPSKWCSNWFKPNS